MAFLPRAADGTRGPDELRRSAILQRRVGDRRRHGHRRGPRSACVAAAVAGKASDPPASNDSRCQWNCVVRRRSRIPRSTHDREGRIYSRLTVLPDQAGPLQRAQLLAALSVGTEIIRLRRVASVFDQPRKLEAALAATVASGKQHACDRTPCRSRPKDDRAARHRTRVADHVAGARRPSLRCPRPLPDTQTISNAGAGT